MATTITGPADTSSPTSPVGTPRPAYLGPRPQAATPPLVPTTPQASAPSSVSAITPQAPSAPAPATPSNVTPNGQLGTDPAYLAYMRGVGLTDADAQAAAQQALARTQARMNNSLSDLGRQQAMAGFKLGGALESRGEDTSSVGRYAIANQDAAYAARQMALRQAAADNLASTLTNLALTFQKGQTGLANAALTAAPTVSGLNAAANNYGISPADITAAAGG